MPFNSHARAAREMVSYCLANLPEGIPPQHVKTPNGPWQGTPNNAPYLRLTVNPLSTVNYLATYAYQRTNGVFNIDIFWPAGTGDADVMAAAEFIQQRFTNRGTENVSFYEVEILPLGDIDDRYQVQVNVTYSHEGKTYAD